VKEFTQVRTMETTLHEWEPMELKYSKFDFCTYLEAVKFNIQSFWNSKNIRGDEFGTVRVLKS
jgi:hypothetical protein